MLKAKLERAQQEVYKLNAKLEQAQQEIEKLKESNKQLNTEIETAHAQAQSDQGGNNTNNQTDRDSHRLEQQAQQTQQTPHTSDAGAASQNKSEGSDFTIGKLYYAFAPTSVQPYGFCMDDWSSEEKGQPFIIQFQNQTEAKFTLTKNDAVRNNLLTSLAYYSRLVDYEDSTKGQQAATKVKVSDVGILRKQGNVWTIQKKIKIKIH